MARAKAMTTSWQVVCSETPQTTLWMPSTQTFSSIPVAAGPQACWVIVGQAACRGKKKSRFHPKPLMRNTRCFKSSVIKSSLMPASHKVHPRPSSCSLLPSIHPSLQLSLHTDCTLLILLKH